MRHASGLKTVIEKKEVVPTRRAYDFLHHPQEVDATYKFHVDTYVPVHIGTASDAQTGIEGFARRFIKRIKAGRSPRGYITAEYGYGKTSTGLYIWEQAIDAGIIALPPFQLNKLDDFLDATYGWVQYQLGLVSPSHQAQAAQIYHNYTRRSLEDTAQHYELDIETIQQMIHDRRLNMDLNTGDILAFFHEMTDLVLDAGFSGLLVMADEIQQYLDPQVRAGVVDPISPLFDIVQGLADEQQELAFGFLLIMPAMQLGLINDQRGDLIDRMRDFTLDLKTVYDREFPARLWHRLSNIFDFQTIAGKVILPETLQSLGQIASRNDLSNGPRTVVNILKLATDRYLQADGQIQPYTPVDLISSFMNDEVAFDGTKKIQEAVRRALDYDFIRAREDLMNAVKLAAAYPQEGVREALQVQWALQDAFEELKASGFGDVVIEVGDRRFPGITLHGLDDVPIETDELALIMRDFARNYIVQADLTKVRAIKGFVALLQNNIFRERDWKVLDTSELDMFHTRELVFEGAFSSIVREFPQRKIHINITLDEIPDTSPQLEGEVTLYFALHRYLDIDPEQRQDIPGETTVNEEHFSAILSLNLMQSASEQVSRQLREQLLKFVNSTQITPLLLLTLHSYLSELIERGQITKRIAPLIESSIHRQILETTIQVLFNPAITGGKFDANGAQIVEKIVDNLIRERYSDVYHTLITYQRWRDVLRSYIGWLKKLPSRSQKRGLTPLIGSKNKIATTLDDSVTGLENKLRRLPKLITIPGESLSAGKNAKNEIYFTLHPLEQQILATLRDTATTITYQDQELHAVHQTDIYRDASAMGYRNEEIEYVILLLEARELITYQENQIIQSPRITLSLDDMNQNVNQFQIQAQHFERAFPEPDAEHHLELAEQYQQRLSVLNLSDEDELLRLYEELTASQSTLHVSLETHLSRTRQQLKDADRSLPVLQDETVQQLAEPIRGSGYTQTLNNIRRELINQYNNFSEEIARLKDQIAEIETINGLLDTGTLSWYVQSVARIVSDAETLTEDWRQYQQNVDFLARWRQFIDDEVQLQDTVAMMGDMGDKFHTELNKLTQNIEIHLEQKDKHALPHIRHFMDKLNSIKEAVNKRRASANIKFDRDQTAYRQTLIRDGGLQESELWDKLPFNPEKPEQFYAHLYSRARQSVARILDELAEQIQYQHDSLTMLKNNQRLIDSGQIDAVGGLQDRLDGLRDALSQPYELNTEEGVRDYEGSFSRMMSLIKNIKHNIHSTRKEVAHLKTLAQAPSRSRDAETIYQVFKQYQTKNSPSVDLVQLHEAIHKVSPDMTDPQFWNAIRELWKEQWIRLDIK